MNKDKEFIRKIKESDLLNDIDKDQLIVDIEETKEKTNEIKNHFFDCARDRGFNEVITIFSSLL